MAGLDDSSSRRRGPFPQRSFIFHAASKNPTREASEESKENAVQRRESPRHFAAAKNIGKAETETVPSYSKPLRKKHLPEDASVASTFRRAASSKHWNFAFTSKQASSHSRSYSYSHPSSPTKARTTTSTTPSKVSLPTGKADFPGAEDRIVVYFTSLRGIRRTYYDCCAVRTIFAGFRVRVDERDISMDSNYRTELQGVLGRKTVTLPQVFIRGKHVGGAEEMKLLYETGELAKLLEGFPLRGGSYACESCWDVRFVPCPNCNGSRKVFVEEEGQLRRCADCNENGLLRCPFCCR